MFVLLFYTSALKFHDKDEGEKKESGNSAGF